MMWRLLIESDIFIAYLKKEDWLKTTALEVISAIEKGKLGSVQISTEVFHELYYVFSDFAPIDIILKDMARIADIENVTFINPDVETYLSALSIIEIYRLKSIFDAVYAATVLSNSVSDHTIITTEHVYDRIKGIKRVDPRELKPVS